tara:strand:- start:2177 stop:4123 length:1947 start_codon:yes stop_codon:yes gene_type:complete
MNITICSIPTEVPGAKLERKRSEGQMGIMPKIAITSLNSWATKHGFNNCKFYDIDMLYPDDEALEEYFKKEKPDIVGLSAVVSTCYLQVKRISKIIRKINSEALIVCGGYLTAAANVVLRKTDVDVCVVGNGEIAWVGLLNYYKEHLENNKNQLDINKLLKIKGIAILDEDELKFSGYGATLPGCEMNFPDFEYLKSGLLNQEASVDNYFREFKDNEIFSMDSRSYEKNRRPNMVNIFTSKGCVAKCTFCQRGSKGYMVYDLDKLDKYLKHLVEDHDVGFLYIDDENFASNKKYTYQIAELFNKYNLLWFAAGVRCTSVTKEDIVHYKKNGCCALKFGIESGSQTMLDIMEKKFTVEDIKKAVFTCYDNGLYSPAVGYMVGMPGESLKTCMESGKMMGEISAHIGVEPKIKMGAIDPYYAIPLVGTPLFEYGKQLGLIGQTVDEEEEYLMMVSQVEAYKRYYMNFNGAPMSEVVFWDILIFLEATRTYVKLTEKKTISNEWSEKFSEAMRVRNENPNVRRKEKRIQVMGDAGDKIDVSFSNYFVTNFVKNHIMFNKTIAKLPRWMVYPIVRYAIYFEFLLQKYFLKDKHVLHKTTNAKVNSSIRIKWEEVDPNKTTQKDRSLRSIVAKRVKDNMTEKERTLSSLTAGP